MDQLIKDIQSGLYCAKQLERMHKDISANKIKMACIEHSLQTHRRRVREEFFQSHRENVRRMWVEDVPDAVAAKNLGIKKVDLIAVRVRFGFISDIRNEHKTRLETITSLAAAGIGDDEISVEMGMTKYAVRSFRMRNGIKIAVVEKGHTANTLKILTPLLYEHYKKSDNELSRISGYSDATIRRYRRLLLRKLIEKEKAAS